MSRLRALLRIEFLKEFEIEIKIKAGGILGLSRIKKMDRKEIEGI